MHPLRSQSASFSLRPATEADVDLIRDLADRIWFASYAQMISREQVRYMLNWMYAPPKLRGEIRRGVGYVIAEFDGVPVGYLAWELLKPGEVAHLHKLYLLPERQGRGLGQAMLLHVETAAIRQGARFLELRVNKANQRACRAYERAGFQPADAVITDIGGGFVMDDYILRKPLTVPPEDCRAGTDSPPCG